MVRYIMIIAFGLLLSGCQSNEYQVGYSDGKKAAKLLYEEEISQLKSELASKDEVILDYLLIIERLKITDNEARKDLAWITFCKTLPWLENLVCTPELMSTEGKLRDQVTHPDNITLLMLWSVFIELVLLTAMALVSLSLAVFLIACAHFRLRRKLSSLVRQINSHEITLQELDDYKRDKSEIEALMAQRRQTMESQLKDLLDGEAAVSEVWKDHEIAVRYIEESNVAKSALRKRFLSDSESDDD